MVLSASSAPDAIMFSVGWHTVHRTTSERRGTTDCHNIIIEARMADLSMYIRACNYNRNTQWGKSYWTVLKIEHWSHTRLNITKWVISTQYVQCMLLFLVLVVILSSFKFYIVTRSYSSHPFLCTLVEVHITFTMLAQSYLQHTLEESLIIKLVTVHVVT